MNDFVENLDLSEFWEESSYAKDNYVEEPVSQEVVCIVEQELGYKIPDAYIALMKVQNGGFPVRTRHRTLGRTSWATDHVAISGLFGIGKSKPCSLCGSMGSQFWVDEWGYPAIGVYFADCPSAGHDMLCLDYRECGPLGEPRVVHVDQESDYKITLVADAFADFIKGLELDEAFDDAEDVQLDEDQVVSAWIDPEFAKEMGIDTPVDGWLKKEREQENDEESA